MNSPTINTSIGLLASQFGNAAVVSYCCHPSGVPGMSSQWTAWR